jgi:hypothetical protein
MGLERPGAGDRIELRRTLASSRRPARLLVLAVAPGMRGALLIRMTTPAIALSGNETRDEYRSPSSRASH